VQAQEHDPTVTISVLQLFTQLAHFLLATVLAWGRSVCSVAILRVFEYTNIEPAEDYNPDWTDNLGIVVGYRFRKFAGSLEFIQVVSAFPCEDSIHHGEDDAIELGLDGATRMAAR
jgi:hypothetical protein